LDTLTLDQKMAQVSCYFPTDVTDTADFAERYPHGVGEVSCLEARMAESLDDVAAFQRRVQEAALAASGIPAIFHMEGLCGAYLPGATSFPSGLARAASFDPELEREIGAVVGRQERAVGITHTLAPVLDVSRDPRMGRHGESYGEDATLAAAMGAAYTEGLQGGDRGGLRSEAVAKHFLGFHASSGGIHGAHCDIPERSLREVYAKPFQAAITHAGLRGIMPCYGSLGGEPVSGSRRLLTGLLREEMGFDGVVVSDYSAIANLHTVQKVAESLADAGLMAMSAGLDVELHLREAYGEALRDWFASGKVEVALLDQAVLRLLTAKFRMGLFEHPFALEGPALRGSFHQAEDKPVALRSSRESIVLLRNDGALPLAGGVAKIAVIGCHAANARFFFGGYTHLSMAEGSLAARSSMAGLVTAADTGADGAAGPGAGAPPVRNVPGTAIQADDAPIFDALLARQQPGIRNLFEELAARLPAAEVGWAYGYPIAGPDESGHAEAITLAEAADVVIMTLGGKHGTSSIASMGEGVDATHINLPPCQETLIAKLAALGKPLIGVHLDGRPISSDAADRCLNAIVEAWSPAEAGAQAIADVLLGEHNPAGKLPVCVARNAGQAPVYHSHPNGSSWHQGESVGFPDYVDCPHWPRYHFGHGLSYTAFEYSQLRLSAETIMMDDAVEVAFRLANAGQVAGTEVAQLYVRDRYAQVSRPALELAGFRRVALEPGESQEVRFALRASQLAFIGADGDWMVEPGEIDILVGASSDDLRLQGVVTIGRGGRIDGRRRAFWAA
jgi:beta-glucosidase